MSATELAADETLSVVVLAAGMGSRFGGLKQLTPVGPKGEWLLDYALFDAWRSGFRHVVFVIQERMEEAFQEHIIARYQNHFAVELAIQRPPEHADTSQSRTKPWGTGHAVLSAIPFLRHSCVVINADDYYGPHAFGLAASDLAASGEEASKSGVMVGYRLGKTLSEHGAVSRGICDLEEGYLRSIRERTALTTDGGRIFDHRVLQEHLAVDTVVSMNFWGLTRSTLKALAPMFEEFFEANKASSDAEFYLPEAIGQLIDRDEFGVRVDISEDPWFGLTYADDRPRVERALTELIRDGVYPSPLWGRSP